MNLIADGIGGRMVAIRGGKYSHSPLPNPIRDRARSTSRRCTTPSAIAPSTQPHGLPLLLGIPVAEDPSLLK